MTDVSRLFLASISHKSIQGFGYGRERRLHSEPHRQRKLGWGGEEEIINLAIR